jgi:SAM-dependent methyltransferase
VRRIAAASAVLAAIARTADRFDRADAGRAHRYYVRGKLRGDPSTHAVAALGPLGDVVDLGCGRGQLDILLLEAGLASRVHGFDWDERKIDLARRASIGLAARFDRADLRDAPAGSADSVLAIDVLHYFDAHTQDALLERAANLVRPGGRLIVRDADNGRGWRSAATRVQEGLTTAIRFNRGERVMFRDIRRELIPRLERQGLSCELTPCWGGTPFSNMLLVATRDAGLAAERRSR